MIRNRVVHPLAASVLALLCVSCGPGPTANPSNANAQSTPSPTVDVVKVASHKLAIAIRRPTRPLPSIPRFQPSSIRSAWTGEPL